MDVGGWLWSRGLEEYETAFRENKSDDRILTKLTAEDLKELCITGLGRRPKLLPAIAELSSAAPTATLTAPQPSSTSSLAAPTSNGSVCTSKGPPMTVEHNASGDGAISHAEAVTALRCSPLFAETADAEINALAASCRIQTK